MLLCDDFIQLFLHVYMFPLPVALTTLMLEPVGFPSLGSLFLQDFGIVQDHQTWDLTDDILSENSF